MYVGWSSGLDVGLLHRLFFEGAIVGRLGFIVLCILGSWLGLVGMGSGVWVEGRAGSVEGLRWDSLWVSWVGALGTSRAVRR